MTITQKFAVHNGWTDVHPYEIMRIISGKTVEVRELDAKLLNGFNSGRPDALQFSPGGFCGHTSGTQVYEFSVNKENPLKRIRLGKKGWKDKYGNKYQLSDEPFKYHDYNF